MLVTDSSHRAALYDPESRAGTVSVTVVPCSALLTTDISPSCSLTTRLTRNKPRPVPLGRVVQRGGCHRLAGVVITRCRYGYPVARQYRQRLTIDRHS